MPTLPRPEIGAISFCPHGAIGDAEMQALGRMPIVDFSVNSNPLGPSPAVVRALANVDPSRYPDSQGLALRKALASRFGLKLEEIAIGNGSSELIWLLAEAYLRPGDRVAILGPTFGEYARAARIHGATPLFFDASEDTGFRLDLADTLSFIKNCRPRLVFLCNPNNPTGLYIRAQALDRLRQACAEGLLVVDEAYLSFVEGVEPWRVRVDDGVVLLRSMTKDYALAGLRLGYALADGKTIAALEKVQPPWSVNALAQAAGIAALADEEHLFRARRTVAEAKEFLVAALWRLGLATIPSSANFLLVRVDRADRFRAALLRKGCCVRDCTSFGLPEYVRIGIRTLPECQCLVKAISEVIDES